MIMIVTIMKLLVCMYIVDKDDDVDVNDNIDVVGMIMVMVKIMKDGRNDKNDCAIMMLH